MIYEDNNTQILNSLWAQIVSSFVGGAILAVPFLLSAYPVLVILSLVIGVFIFTNVNSVKRAAILGAIFGFTFFMFQGSWVAYLKPYAGNWAYIGWLALAAMQMSAFIVIAIASYVIHRKVDSWIVTAFSMSTLFVAIEIIRSLGVPGYPMGLIGIPFVDVVPIARLAAFLGWPGLSFMAIFISSLTALAFKKQPGKKEVSIAISVIFVVFLLANWPQGLTGESYRRVAVLQPNISIDDKKDILRPEVNYKILKDMIRKVSADVDYIVAPETSLPGYYPGNKMFLDELSKLAGANLIIGSLKKTDKGIFNTAFSENDQYDKNNLVLFGENVPFKFLIDHIKPLNQSLTPGKKAKVLGKTAVLICSESLDWLYSRKVIGNRAELIAVISNDTWFGKSSFAAQHLNASRLRAVENGRYLVTASNSGYSAIVDPEGRVLQKSGLGKRVLLIGNVSNKTNRTFFNKYGYWINLLFIGAGLIASLVIVKKN